MRSILFAFLFSLIFLASLLSYVTYLDTVYAHKVYKGVTINGIDLSGKTITELKKVYERESELLDKTVVTIAYEDQVYATFSASQLGATYSPQKFVEQPYLLGRKKNTVENIFFKITHELLHQKSHLSAIPQYKDAPVQEHLDYITDTYGKPAQDALFEIKSGKVVAFKIDKPGIGVQSAQTMMEMRKYMTSRRFRIEPAITIAVQTVELPAKIRIGEINTYGITEKIGEGKSNYSHSSAERIHNLSLATSRMHGILIPPGEIFSYNKSLGEISARTGYKQGYIIQNGRTVLGDGGGVCQVSSTLFRAALNTGLPITQRKAHSYRVVYYENDSKPGLDATAFAPTVDFRFKNDTPNHILIQTTNDRQNKLLTFEFYGKGDGRVATLSPIKVWDVTGPPEPKYVDDPTLPRGVTKQVDFPAGGAKSSFTYTVKRGGETLQNQTFYSVYRPWQAVYMVGVRD